MVLYTTSSYGTPLGEVLLVAVVLVVVVVLFVSLSFLSSIRRAVVLTVKFLGAYPCGI